MAESSVLISEFYNQFNNGEDFSLNPSDITANLSANITEKVKTKQRISFSWTDESSVPYPFRIILSGNTLRRVSANFIVAGFTVGDTISLWNNGTGTYLFEDRTITSMNDNTIWFDGAVVVEPIAPLVDAVLYGKTLLTSCRFQYNLIENSEPTNFVSKIDGLAENAFTATDIDAIGVPLNPVVGVNSWKVEDETATIKFIGQGTREELFAQVFEIEHEFSVLPWFRDGELSNVQDLIPPLLFSGTNNLKYVYNAAFNIALSNPNGTKNVLSTSTNGKTGWFNEPLNDLLLDYYVTDLFYYDTASGDTINQIDARRKTTVQYNLNSLEGRINLDSTIVAGISTLPSESDYQQNANTINENFLLDRVYTAVNDLAVDGSIITNFTVNRISIYLAEVEFDIEYTTDEEGFNQNKHYVLFNNFQSSAAPSINTDRTCLKIDSQQFFYDPDVKEQVYCGPIEHFPHDVDDTDTPNAFDNIVGWLETGFSIKTLFELNARKLTRVEAMRVNLSAYNPITGNRFDLQTANFNVSGSVVVPVGTWGYQAIEIDTTRGFKLVNGSQFNKVKVTTLPGYVLKPGIGEFTQYELYCGIKANFEEWIALPGADAIFYNASEPNNGLNKKISNYSLKEDYEIVVIIEFDVRESDEPQTQTNYQFISQAHNYFDFDLDGNVPPDYSVDIITLDESGANTSGVVKTSEDTTIRATFTPDSGSTSFVNPYAIVRLNQRNGNINTIYELSSIRESINNNLLIPLVGESYTKLTDNGSTVVVECLIDGFELDSEIDYTVTVELRESSTEIGIATELGVLIATESGDIIIKE